MIRFEESATGCICELVAEIDSLPLRCDSCLVTLLLHLFISSILMCLCLLLVIIINRVHV